MMRQFSFCVYLWSQQPNGKRPLLLKLLCLVLSLQLWCPLPELCRVAERLIWLYVIAEWPKGGSGCMLGLVVCYLTGLHNHVWNLDASQFLLDFSFITSGSNLVVVLAARFFVANCFIKQTIMSNIPFFPKWKIEIEKDILKNQSYFCTFFKLSKQVARI